MINIIYNIHKKVWLHQKPSKDGSASCTVLAKDRTCGACQIVVWWSWYRLLATVVTYAAKPVRAVPKMTPGHARIKHCQNDLRKWWTFKFIASPEKKQGEGWEQVLDGTMSPRRWADGSKYGFKCSVQSIYRKEVPEETCKPADGHRCWPTSPY